MKQMQEYGGAQGEPDYKTDQKASQALGKTFKDVLYDFRHGDVPRKIELWITTAVVGIIGTLFFVLVENSVDKPRIIIGLMFLAAIGSLIVIWIRVDRYWRAPSRLPADTNVSRQPVVPPVANGSPKTHPATAPASAPTTTAPTVMRSISNEQRQRLKEGLAACGFAYADIIRVGFTDDKETKHFAEELTRALMDCGWSVHFHEENIHINLGQTRNFSGVSLFAFNHLHMPAMVALKHAMEAAGIRLAPCFIRPDNRPPSYDVIEIVVGPNRDDRPPPQLQTPP